MDAAAHLRFWPPGVPRQLGPVDHTLDDNLRRAAASTPDKAALVFYGAVTTYAELDAEVSRVAGWLQAEGGVRPGDRVGLFMQNAPQFVAGFYGIVRAGGVAVPLNAMYRTAELRHIVADAGIRVVLAAQDLIEPLQPLLDDGSLARVLAACYADALPQPRPDGLPAWLTMPPAPLPAGVSAWSRIRDVSQAPEPVVLSPGDLCALPYTSGSTGVGKGCRHTHATTLHAVACITEWFGFTADDVVLAAAPMFHVVGLQAGLNAGIARGATLVILPRWDRGIAADLIRRFGVTVWPTVPTAVIDFLNRPDLRHDDLATLRVVCGGGSAMPEAVAQQLHEMTGLRFVECYGMTETMAPVTQNPPQRPKEQSVGVPAIGTEVLVLDVDTRAPLTSPGAVGEIAVSGPQVMRGYWNAPHADAEAFVQIGDRRFLRTGDLGHVDDDGYFHVTDRIKRMINVSGYKVWPTEVESRLFAHPAIADVCVIAARDAYRGETVKAVAVLKPGHTLTADELQHWAQQRMAAYKVPRLLQLVQTLPKSGAGKVLWRELQDAESARAHPPSTTTELT